MHKSDPRHRQTHSLAVLALTTTLLLLAATGQVAAVDNDLDGIQDDLENQLLNKHAPLVLLHPSEDRWPANVEWFLDHATFRFHHGGGCSDDPILNYPSQGDLVNRWHNKKHSALHLPPCTHYNNPERSWIDYDENQAFFLQVINDGDHHGPSDSAQWKVYGHAYPNRDLGINLQYWFFYVYNEGAFGFNHEGDWENVIVQLDPAGSVSNVIFYSHEGSRTVARPGVTWYDQDHPVVMSSLGAHASYENYQECADYKLTFGERGCSWATPPEVSSTAWFTWAGGKPADAPGFQGGGIVNVGERRLDMIGYFNSQHFIHYSGHWGEIGAPRPHLPGTCLPAGCKGNFSGPRGPAYQSAWSRNRAPEPENQIAYVDDDFDSSTPGWGEDHFDSLYSGIFNVVEGGTVYVSAGTYPEKFAITKSVRLIGVDGQEVTVIDGQGQRGSPVIRIDAGEVWISGFTIRDGSVGIEMYEASETTITENTITGFSVGILFWWDSANNKIYHNNFENGGHVNSTYGGVNEWSYGLVPGGNYWDDYSGVDVDGDGIGEAPYSIYGSDDQDEHPFVERDGWKRQIDPQLSWIEVADSQMFTCPAGDAPHGSYLKAHIINSDGIPIEGYPASQLIFEAEPDDSATQSYGPVAVSVNAVDTMSSVDGVIRFDLVPETSISGSILLSGRLANADEIEIEVQDAGLVGEVILDANSADINVNGVVELGDISLFSGALTVYDWRADFNWDGDVDLSDVTKFTTHNGHAH